MAQSYKITEPLSKNGWAETKVAHIRLDKCKHIYYRAKTPNQTFEQIKRSLLVTDVYHDLTEKRKARGIAIISNSLIVVI